MTRRWTILRKLGEGGRGSVHLARSPEGQNFAVKTLVSLDAETTASFELEASLLIRLRHPGIARVHGYLKNSAEIFGEDRGPCFWMEFVDGPDVVGAARSLKEDREETVLRWFSEALEALEYLHHENVIHGDLTPQNLRVGADGRLKVIDFGFASIGRVEILPDGTLLYMAPERFQGIKDEAGDLFSLGTVFYEALAGVHPREGRKSLTEMYRKPPEPLAAACPSLLPKFSVEGRVIDALVSARPVDRFGSPGEALRAIRSRSPKKRSAGETYFSRLFYGAEPFLQAVDAALADKSPKTSFFAVHGSSGTGRTRFLQEVLFRGSLAGRPVFDVPAEEFSRGIARLESPAAIPAVSLFRNLEKVPRAELSKILSLHRCAASRGVIVFEWNEDAIDQESKRLLLHSPLALRWTDVALKNLNEDETKDFLSRGLGPAVAGEVAADLFQATRGNPRLLGDWVTYFRDHGWADKTHFSKNWLASAGAPLSADALLEARWRGLDVSARSVLEALAIDGGPAALEELLDVVRSASAGENGAYDDSFGWTVLEALDRLGEQGLTIVDADPEGHAAYRIALEPFRRLSEKSVDAERARALHEAWLKALSLKPEENVRKIRHRIALKDAGRFVPSLERATTSLRRAERHREALELVEEAFSALDSKADPVLRSRLLRMKTNLLNEMGRYREALACCEENLALAAADEPLAFKRVKYWMVTGLIFEHLGDSAEALTRFQSCLKEAATLDGEAKASYLARSETLIGKQLFARGETDAAVERFERARALSAAQTRERGEAIRNLAVARARQGRREETDSLLEEAAALYRKDGYYPGEFAVLLLKGNLGLERGDLAAADRAYAEAEAVAISRRDDLLLARVWNNQGVLARLLGDLARAHDRGQRSLEIFRALGNPADLSESLKQNVMTRAELGRFAEGELLLKELREMADVDGRWSLRREDAQRAMARMRDGAGWEASDGSHEAIRRDLEKWHASLPKELQVSFVERFDYRKFVLNKEG